VLRGTQAAVLVAFLKKLTIYNGKGNLIIHQHVHAQCLSILRFLQEAYTNPDIFISSPIVLSIDVHHTYSVSIPGLLKSIVWQLNMEHVHFLVKHVQKSISTLLIKHMYVQSFKFIKVKD
jgi:hypothetical protein